MRRREEIGETVKYFMLSQDRRYAFTPRLLGLYYVLDREDITRARAHRLPKEAVVFIADQDEYDLPDLLDAGFFLVSEEVAHVFSFYDESIPFSDVILLNKSKRTEFRYRLPVFEDVDCLHPACKRSVGGFIEKTVLDKDKVKGRRVFRIGPSELEQKPIIVRLDVAESLLRRGLKGLVFTETEVR
jgi:hypothetical protein